MPASDFMECILADQIEPFIDRRMDLLMGILSSVVANVNRDPKSKPFKPADFMPKWNEGPRSAADSQEQERVKMLIFEKVHNFKLEAAEARKRLA